MKARCAYCGDVSGTIEPADRISVEHHLASSGHASAIKRYEKMRAEGYEQGRYVEPIISPLRYEP